MKKNILISSLIILSAVIFVFIFLGNNKKIEKKETIDKAKQEEIVEKPKQEEEIITNQENYMDYIITLKTNKGEIQFETYVDDAPNTVQNFVSLANKGFYDGVIFHRVIDGFMIQGGDPTGTGMGGPGYTFNDEINSNSKIYQDGYPKGIVAMANSGPNTQGSQFFIMVNDYPLPPSYTIFGKVISGQETADSISLVEKDANDRPIEDVVIEKVLIEEK